MTPQADFLVLAPIRAGQIEPLRALIAGCTLAGQPGHADPANAHFDFTKIPTLHNIRVALLEDPSIGDRAIYAQNWPEERVGLALLGCCDGDADHLLQNLSEHMGKWLSQLFAHCEGFVIGDDVLCWMRARVKKSAASYVNGPGRTVQQIHQEAKLSAMLRTKRAGMQDGGTDAALSLRRAVAMQQPALTRAAPPPWSWCFRTALYFLSLPLVAVIFALMWRLTLPVLILSAWWLRRLETRDAVIVIAPDPAEIARRSAYEDHDNANPFTAIGSLKPGMFRWGVVVVVLFVIDWAARYLFRKGRLGRVGTIHFARWVLIDKGRRVVFTSEYDGSAEAYMDDFINKVGFGLNASFSNGIGYPRTRWLVLDGASDEQRFKYFMRHHQIITQFWWRAYPGLTTFDLARNSRIRQGFDRAPQTDAQADRWLAEIG